jgi:hypothetical protein
MTGWLRHTPGGGDGSDPPGSDATSRPIGNPIAVELLAERDIPTAWEYDAQILTGAAIVERKVLRLSWADYQMWSPDGAIAPSRVAEAVLRFIALHAEAFAMMEVVDAAVARRKVPGADAAIAALLRGD